MFKRFSVSIIFSAFLVGCASQPVTKAVNDNSPANTEQQPLQTATNSNLNSETISIIGGGVAAILVNPLAGVVVGIGAYTILESDEF
ncbi:hypothetical protein [Thalassotalea sp. ND16A]|uniref:hypothetical protein n=1 Tax=Thalassotalea sp. ND16A TaxID=1535422 RepID=UPI00051A5926|nr:hypothetical protein [Thalassotalea sp. ND16A]KGJ89444.1 hypothetical protein ND16A_2337 [Thalassotalea sp. ND16A]